MIFLVCPSQASSCAGADGQTPAPNVGQATADTYQAVFLHIAQAIKNMLLLGMCPFSSCLHTGCPYSQCVQCVSAAAFLAAEHTWGGHMFGG